MAIQQINISDWFLKVGTFLEKDADIKEFCKTTFSKDLIVHAGEILPKEEPKEDSCPFVVLYGAHKAEGVSQGVCSYSCNIGIGISLDDTKFANEAGVVMHNAYDAISHLMLLIQKELNLYKPMAKVESTIGGAVNPNGTYWVGDMAITWEIEQTLGMGASQDFQ